MSRVAIVAMGVTANQYFRSAETTGDTSLMFDEVWAINGFGHIFACDRVFAMDDIRLQALRGKAGNVKIGNLVNWIRKTKIPVITSRALPATPNLEGIEDAKAALSVLPKTLPDGSENEEYARQEAVLATLEIEKELIDGGGFESLVEFPLQDVINRFHVHPYFNNTVAYAQALAAYERHDVTIYGADFHYPENLGRASAMTESGRGCCEYWVGIAISHGLKVDITRESTLLDSYKGSPLYGYDGCDVEGTLDPATGQVIIKLTDIPLPSALAIEQRYWKGPPGTSYQAP